MAGQWPKNLVYLTNVPEALWAWQEKGLGWKCLVLLLQQLPGNEGILNFRGPELHPRYSPSLDAFCLSVAELHRLKSRSSPWKGPGYFSVGLIRT